MKLAYPLACFLAVALAGPHAHGLQVVQRPTQPCPHSGQPPNTKRVGVNLNQFRHNSSSIVPADLAKRGSNWFEADPNGEPTDTRADETTTGWPTEPAVSCVFLGGFQRPIAGGSPMQESYVLEYLVGDQSSAVQTDIILNGFGTISETSSTFDPATGLKRRY
jgi:hypothetical protein